MKGNKGNKSSHIGVWLMIALIAVISYFAFIGALKDGITLNKENVKGIDNIESLSDLKDKVYFKIDIPSYVSESKEKLNIEVVAGQVVSINTTYFVMKASSFVDINADILGLYEESATEKRYNVKDSDIIYFKYRQGYADYPSCTIINWYTNETSYGIMIEDNINLDMAIEIIGLSKDKLYEDNNITVDSNSDTENDTEYIMSNKYLIKLPEFKGNVTHVDIDGVSAFFTDDNLLFLVVYNDEDIRSGVYSEQSVVDVDDNIKIYYDSNNTYDKGSDAYSDYELMLSKIDSIAKTIVCK